MPDLPLSHLLMVGLPDNDQLPALAEVKPGGVILMGRNAGTPDQVRRLGGRLAEALAYQPLIATDQEGGRVQRLTEGFTPLPAMQQAGEAGPTAIGILASTVAGELRQAGVHWNLAPVCDVPQHPDDTVISSRALAVDPLRAAVLAGAYIRGAQPTVACAAKHFPGHGAAGADSHQQLPICTISSTEWRSRHWPPFQAAIAAGVTAIMTGHLAAPALDPSGRPASLSPDIVEGCLRQNLGFSGLIVTDDMEMGALPRESPGTLALQALLAGNDMLLYCHRIETAREVVEALRRALESGVLSEARVRTSLLRQRHLRTQIGLESPHLPDF